MFNSFETFCRSLNEVCRSLQDKPKEIVSDEQAFAAYACLRQMRIADAGDVVLFCAAMNLLNTYVKQDQQHIGYAFKQETDHLTGILSSLSIPDVVIDLQKDKGMTLLVVDILGLQFSFHNISRSEELLELDARNGEEDVLKWDGIRKQHCAATLFTLALRNRERRCLETFRGKDLEEKLDSLLSGFREGRISFDDLLKTI